MTTPYLDGYFIEVDGVLKEATPATNLTISNGVRVKSYAPQNGFLIIKDKEN